jgi:hypothetical protein
VGRYGQICDIDATALGNESMLAHLLTLDLGLVLQSKGTTARAAGILPIYQVDLDAERQRVEAGKKSLQLPSMPEKVEDNTMARLGR